MKLIAILVTTTWAVTGVSTYCIAQASQPEFIVSRPLYLPAENTVLYQLGDARIPFKVLQYGDRNDIVCVNVHDNESSSVEAAKIILENTGGTLLRIDNNKQRVIRFRLRGVSYAFDPNRIFSRQGIEQSLKENCGRTSPLAIDEIEKFAERLLAFIPDSVKCIIALHNNTNEAFSIKSYLEGSDREHDAREVSHNLTQDPDDIILTTDEALFRKMSELGYNAIWQDNENAKRDGSLSIWSGENGRRYINIETQHGKVKQYEEMMESLIQYLDANEP